jgi:cytochrome c6
MTMIHERPETSWPALCRPSTSCFSARPKTWMPAFAGMTSILLAAFTALALTLPLSPALAADPSPEDIDQGRALYDESCATCHGRDMVTSGVAAPDLRKFPKDDESRFRNSVLQGKGGMPAWRDKLSDADLQLLWAYIRSGG